MSTYGEFCPVAKAMEILDERWTLLVIRELLAGTTRFNDLRRGNPKMSPALLTKRLRSLERAGVVRRATVGHHTAYTLTEAGEELRPIVDAIGTWGVRWIRDLGDEDLDPHLLMWDIKRTVPVGEWPRQRTVLQLDFADVPPKARDWWLVVDGGRVDVCDVDPGYEPTVSIHTDLRTLTHVWRGDVTWDSVIGSGAVVLEGPPDARRAVPRWVGAGGFAEVPRPREGAQPDVPAQRRADHRGDGRDIAGQRSGTRSHVPTAPAP